MKKKKIPALKNDRKAEKLAPKTTQISVLMPVQLLTAVKKAAAKAKMPYQRFIRQTLETAVQPRGRS